MPQFKKFSGNYVDVINTLGLPPAFYSPQANVEEYDEQIAKDLTRTSYLSLVHDVDYMKQQLRDRSHLSGDALSYSQGNFDGGVFTDSHIKTSSMYMDVAMLSSMEGTVDGAFNGLRIAYIDDAGRNCAIAISYLRNDPDPEKGEVILPVAERKRFFSVVIIKDTTLAPKDRMVTYLSHPAFLTEEVAKKGQELSTQAIQEVIAQDGNSKVLNILLIGLFSDDSISMQHFESLNNRLSSNRNLNDRESLKNQLKNYDTLNDAFKAEMAKIKKAADANKAPVQSKDYNTNFFQRNVAALVVGLVSFLAALSLVLILSGVFAPLGLTLMGGIAIAGIITAAAATLISLIAAVKMVHTEFIHSRNNDKYDLAQQTYLEASAQSKLEMEGLKSHFDQSVSELLGTFKGSSEKTNPEVEEPQAQASNESLELDEKMLDLLDASLNNGESEAQAGLKTKVHPPVIGLKSDSKAVKEVPAEKDAIETASNVL